MWIRIKKNACTVFLLFLLVNYACPYPYGSLCRVPGWSLLKSEKPEGGDADAAHLFYMLPGGVRLFSLLTLIFGGPPFSLISIWLLRDTKAMMSSSEHRLLVFQISTPCSTVLSPISLSHQHHHALAASTVLRPSSHRLVQPLPLSLCPSSAHANLWHQAHPYTSYISLPFSTKFSGTEQINQISSSEVFLSKWACQAMFSFSVPQLFLL